MKLLKIQPYDKFNKLTFLEETDIKFDKNWKKIKYGMFECECGKTKVMMLHNVVNGLSKSCGCLQKQSLYNTNRKQWK